MWRNNKNKKEKIDEILSSNKEIKDTINGLKLNIENIIRISSNDSINIQLKNINCQRTFCHTIL